MGINKETKIGEIVSRDFRTAGIFEKLGLDYCCGGKQGLGEACAEHGLDVETVISGLTQAGKQSATAAEAFGDMSPEDLINHIVSRHHKYIKGATPEITQRLEKTTAKHGSNYPHLSEALTLFKKLGEEMTYHMMREEKVLFPYIDTILRTRENGDNIRAPLLGHFDSVQIPIDAMEREHVEAGNLTAQIRKVCNDFQTPEDACMTFKAAYEGLKQFEEDLHVHIHLENNILFPKAIEMEKEIRGM